MFVFQDKITEIDALLERSRKKWHLDAVQWMDYDDVCQIIRLHISKKWHLWDQTRTFGPWANRVISHQITNLIRNNYTSFQKPCLKCPHYTSDNGCNFTETKVQDTSCDDYAKWSKKKKNNHDVKLTLSIENQVIDHAVCINNEFDYDHSVNRLHFEVMKRLSGDPRKIYKALYIDERDEAFIILEPYFNDEKTDSQKNKKLELLKKSFYQVAQEVMREEDVL